MLQYTHIDPVAIHLGPINVHWYGLMYIFAIFSGWFLTSYRAKIKPWAPIKPEQVSDVALYFAFGMYSAFVVGDQGGDFGLFPFHLMLFLGFGFVFFKSLTSKV